MTSSINLMTSSIDLWIDEYKIHSYEADIKGHATIPFLCQFMQESAWNHAEHLGVGFSHLIEKNSAWVLSRQLIAIDLFPRCDVTAEHREHLIQFYVPAYRGH
jgi:hypothetical protein